MLEDQRAALMLAAFVFSGSFKGKSKHLRQQPKANGEFWAREVILDQVGR